MDKTYQCPTDGQTGKFAGQQGEIILIKCDCICPDPSRPFTKFSYDELSGLAKDFLRRGIGIPATVRSLSPFGSEKYLLVAGEKIFRAALLARIERIPCSVLPEEVLPRRSPPDVEEREKIVIRDPRLFFNSITHSVDLMRKSGVGVSLEEETSALCTVLKITVPKSPPI